MKTHYLQSKDGKHIISTESPEHWSEYTRLTDKAGKEAHQKQSADMLRKWLKPGSTVWTILRHVSSSGMSRRISCLILVKGAPMDISGYVADVIDYRRNDKDGAIITGGCGMDMGFHLVYSLSRRLWPNGYKLPKGESGRNGDTSGKDTDGGYALKQRWI